MHTSQLLHHEDHNCRVFKLITNHYNQPHEKTCLFCSSYLTSSPVVHVHFKPTIVQRWSTVQYKTLKVQQIAWEIENITNRQIMQKSKICAYVKIYAIKCALITYKLVLKNFHYTSKLHIINTSSISLLILDLKMVNE